MSEVLAKMLEQLSDDDKQVFSELSERLKQNAGGFNCLSDSDKKLIQQLEKKYGEKTKQIHQLNGSIEEDRILELPFAQYVRQVLARDLGEQFPQEEDAIAFVFENKWLPYECQKEEFIVDLFKRFEDDIYEVNQWREDLVEVKEDTKMAVGLAWFMIIFQLNKRFNV